MKILSHWRSIARLTNERDILPLFRLYLENFFPISFEWASMIRTVDQSWKKITCASFRNTEFVYICELAQNFLFLFRVDLSWIPITKCIQLESDIISTTINPLIRSFQYHFTLINYTYYCFFFEEININSRNKKRKERSFFIRN